MIIRLIRWAAGLVFLAAAARWAWLAMAGDTGDLAAMDPETGLTLRIRLTPAEIADAIERERRTELLG